MERLKCENCGETFSPSSYKRHEISIQRRVTLCPPCIKDLKKKGIFKQRYRQLYNQKYKILIQERARDYYRLHPEKYVYRGYKQRFEQTDPREINKLIERKLMQVRALRKLLEEKEASP